jgi:hypothetical protein
MFTGATGTGGTGAVILYASSEHPGVPKVAMKLPRKTLAVGDVFPNGRVEFPFNGLDRGDRRALSACFTGK